MNPKVSIITCTYNDEKYIAQAIESILKQTFTDFEYIIVNDKSVDETVKIVKSFKDPRIKLIENKENMGAYASANVGISQAKGKYIARMDADDISTPSRIEKQFNLLESRADIAATGSWGMIIDELGNLVKEKIYAVESYELLPEMFFGTSIMHSTLFFRKEAGEKVGFYSEYERKTMDFDFYFKLLNAGYNLYNIPEYLVLYRVHPTSMTSTGFDHQEQVAKAVILKNLDSLLELKADPNDISLLRRALIGHMDGFGRRAKLRVLNYCRDFILHFREKFSDNPKSIDYAELMCKHVIGKIISNRILNKLARIYVLRKFIQ
jgi:glycosyltransferase involved in cell wall biosynthesis